MRYMISGYFMNRRSQAPANVIIATYVCTQYVSNRNQAPLGDPEVFLHPWKERFSMRNAHVRTND
jgi:hypothetical protein